MVEEVVVDVEVLVVVVVVVVVASQHLLYGICTHVPYIFVGFCFLIIVDPATTTPLLSYFMNAFNPLGLELTGGIIIELQHNVVGTSTHFFPSGGCVRINRTVGIISSVAEYLT